MRLNLGAGSLPMAGWINTDLVAMPGIDVAHDLDQLPWPWPDASSEEIRAYDVFEHVGNPLGFMAECWRVLQPGGLLRLHTCHIGNPVNAFTDPTHKRFLTPASFDYWIRGTALHERYGLAYALGNPDVGFNLVSREIGSDLAITLARC